MTAKPSSPTAPAVDVVPHDNTMAGVLEPYSASVIRPMPDIRDEVASASTVHPLISALTQGFVRYLREPRFLTPLTLEELKVLFSNFYDDLNGLVLNVYTQSNSCKKRLIAQLAHFNAQPHHYDYLLAIAHYLLSSIKLSKRTDNESLMQLRVFSYYKYLTVERALEQAHQELFSASTLADGLVLHEKLQRFDGYDIEFQTLLDEKLMAMKDIPFEAFSEGEGYPLAAHEDQLLELRRLLGVMKTRVTPRQKLDVVVRVQQRLIELLAGTMGDKSVRDVSADHLLPVFIHFLVCYGADCDLYLSFIFIKNFLNLLDPASIDAQHYTTHSSFSSYVPEPRLVIHKKRPRKLLLECLNLNPNDTAHPANGFDFFDSDKKLAAHLHAEHVNNGELMYFLTNFEAALFFLLNVTADELLLQSEAEVLSASIVKLVEKKSLTQFKFPEDTKSEAKSDAKTDAKTDPKPEPKVDTGSSTTSPARMRNPRSRSTSLLNAISTRLNGAMVTSRLRSNSGSARMPRKEAFPSMDIEDGSGLLMRSLISRFSLVLVPQLRTPSDGDSDSIDARLDCELAFMGEEPNDTKRNSLSSKLSTGVSELMTRIGQAQHLPQSLNQTRNHSLSTIGHQASQTSLDLKGEARSRTTSIQIMDRWFGAISQPVAENDHNDSTVESQEESSVFSAPFRELTKYQDIDFDSLTIQDLRTLKTYYDQLCTELGVGKSESKTTDHSQDEL